MSKASSPPTSASVEKKARTRLPFDFSPEAMIRIRKRNAERRAKGLPLWTPGAFGGLRRDGAAAAGSPQAFAEGRGLLARLDTGGVARRPLL